MARCLEAYPPERLAHIRDRTEWAWHSANATQAYDDRIAYLVHSTCENEVSRDFPVPADATEVQAEMIRQLQGMAYNAATECERYPGFASGIEQVTIPSMFGCVTEGIADSNRIRPVIKSPSDVYSLPPAEIREGTVCHAMLSRIAETHRRARGRLPVYMTDIQGPFSCAAQMWGIEDFLGALGDHESEIHHLLSLCTEAIIRYFEAMYDATDGTLIPIHCFPYLWVPRDCGVAVSDDFFAIVGTETVRDFSVPYLERIGAAFGGVTVHTCGNMNHLPAEMNAMKTLRAVNFSSSETDLARYARACDPRIAILAHQSGMSIGGLPVLDVAGQLRHCAATQRDTGVTVIALWPWAPEPADAPHRAAWHRATQL